MIGTKQPKVLAAFYEKVLEKPADMIAEDSGFWGWRLGSAFISVLEHSAMRGGAKDAGRVMFNFGTPQVKSEFERIKSLGGVVIKEPYEMEGDG
jgi:predicted enzyme related to lactoylglutathione lyase